MYNIIKNEFIFLIVFYLLNEVWGNMFNSCGCVWINVLINDEEVDFEIFFVFYKDVLLGREKVWYILVVFNFYNCFLCVWKGEIGLDEGWVIVKYVCEIIKEDWN